MHRNWKKVAECADTQAFSSFDIAAEVVPALARDWNKEVSKNLLTTLKSYFGNDNQGTLLSTASDIEALRPLAVGPTLGNLVVDYAIQSIKKAQGGLNTLQSIIKNALSEWAHSRGRQIEEHYYRESDGRRAANVRARIENGIGQSAIDGLAAQIVGNSSSVAAKRPTKKDGLDDGVSF
jgi:hypothetical protein